MVGHDARQRHTDEQRKLADERSAARRYWPNEEFDYAPPRLPQPASFEKLTNFSDLLAQWEEQDRKKKQDERDELKAFNLKYGYQP